MKNSLFFSKIAPHVLNSDKPEYFFSLFFTDDMLLDVVNFTNDKTYELLEDKIDIVIFTIWCENNNININMNDIIYINNYIENDIVFID